MKTSHLVTAALLAGAAAITIPAFAQRTPDSGPVARYDMRAGTVSGFGGMGGMNPMAMMFGGGRGNQVQHELLLRLGSSNGPDKGRPKADHFMPSGAKLGKSVALVTPRDEPEPRDVLPGETWREGQPPRGRILLYWGCGEHAPAGQPVVIDLANLTTGQVPQGLFNSNIPWDWGPDPRNSTTFGRWPAEDGKYARPDSSLIGAHRVAGNYSPEIAFSLSKDFMAPFELTVAGQGSGASLLSWRAIPDATGFVASLFGGRMGPNGDMGDMVMWSSSAGQQFGGGLTDWLTPAQVAPLVRDNTLLGPDTVSCMVPAEVIRDAPDFRMGTLTAFGPEENFSWPPRPDDAATPWHLEWTARIRHRSTTSWMEAQGMTMGTATPDSPGQQQCRPRGGLLGGVMGGVLGGGSGC